jgi:hypothetical protein
MLDAFAFSLLLGSFVTLCGMLTGAIDFNNNNNNKGSQ